MQNHWPFNRKKRWGHPLVKVGLKFSGPFAAALKQLTALESKRQGEAISQSAVLAQLALKGSRELRELLQLEQSRGSHVPPSTDNR